MPHEKSLEKARQVRSDHLGDHRQRKHRVKMYTADPKSRKAVAGVATLHPPPRSDGSDIVHGMRDLGF